MVDQTAPHKTSTERVRLWRKANPDKVRAYRDKTREIMYFRSRRRYYLRRQRTPRWIKWSELRAVYMACPEGMHVDHIVPLDGLTAEGYWVTGLNVPWNLQYLTPAENVLKGDRMRLEDDPISPPSAL